jgi:hypothetical protein
MSSPTSATVLAGQRCVFRKHAARDGEVGGHGAGSSGCGGSRSLLGPGGVVRGSSTWEARAMPQQTDTGARGEDKAATRGRPPADGSGRDVLGRVRALAESVRRQMAARRQNSARPGGPKGGAGSR